MVVTGAALACALGGASNAAGAPFAGPDRPFATPAAKPGTPYAAKSGLNRHQLRRKLAAQVRAQGGVKGVEVVDLDARKRRQLFAANASKRLLLASNSKLFTTAAVLDHFGSRERFATRLYARGRRVGSSRARLKGSLVLVGAGDPALASGSFARAHNLPQTRIGPLAAAVKKAGIRRIDGNIKADPTIFDSRALPPESGITPEGELGTLAGLEYNSGFADSGPLPNPPKEAAQALVKVLEKKGVKLKGRVKVGGTPSRLLAGKPLGKVKSPTTAELVAEVNTPSNDMWAEMLTKRLVATGKRRGTTAGGVKRIEHFSRRIGVHVHLQNGSGLSRRNKASAGNVVKLLRVMNGTSNGAAYRHSLAKPCQTGTVSQRMCGTAAEHRCRTKTGTLRDVSALSGYCKAGRHLLAFSVLMNNVTDFDAAHKHQDRIAALIARYHP